MTTAPPEPADVRVARGATLLDERVPGWHYRINVDKLNLTSCSNCTLGQLFGPAFEASDQMNPLDFSSGLFVTWLRGREGAILNGFDLGKVVLGAPYTDFEDNDAWAMLHGFITGSSETAYAELTELWRTAIADREPF